MRILWRERATLDLDEIHAFIRADNPAAASKAVIRLRAATLGLLEFPQRGRAGVYPGTFELVVPGLPYVIVYRLSESYVEVLTVVHGARRA